MNRRSMHRWLILIILSAVLLAGGGGCARSSATWTGLTVFQDELYAADLDQVQVLNTEDGSESDWAFPEDPKEDRLGTFYATPVVSQEYVFVASQVPARGFLGGSPQNVLWALQTEDGREAWSFDGAQDLYVEGGALAGGLYVVGNSDGNVYALDVDTGTLEWTFSTDNRVWASPLIEEEIVYIGSMDRSFYALNLSTGQEIWRFRTDGAFAGKPALADGVLYIGAFNNQLYALDAREGTEQWAFEGQNWFWGGPLVHNDVIYAVDVNGNVYAVDSNGQEIWQERLEVPVRGGPAMTDDGSKLFVGSEDGTLYALDTAGGDELWSEGNEGQMYASPVVDDSTVYVALMLDPHRIIALNVENGQELWAFPEDEQDQNE